MPRPIILTSWVGYDTDGRTDIGWWDTLRLRLEMKRLQLLRLQSQFKTLAGTETLSWRTGLALEAVDAQLAVVPPGRSPRPSRPLPTP